jgi:hypothetical protein
MPQSGPFDLSATYLRLRPDASVEPLAVDATFWQRLGAGELGTFHNEYLVAVHTFDADWRVWEMHPNGDEVVCLLSGAATFVLEERDGRREVALEGAAATSSCRRAPGTRPGPGAGVACSSSPPAKARRIARSTLDLRLGPRSMSLDLARNILLWCRVSNYKIGILLLNLVPYLALRIVA